MATQLHTPDLPDIHRIWQTLRRRLEWLVTTSHTDPAQQGAARVLAGMLLFGTVIIPMIVIASAVAGDPLAAQLSNAVMGAIVAFAWWINRRGSRFGGLIVALLSAITQPLYLRIEAVQLTLVPLLIGTTLILAVLFSGLWAGIVTIAAYCVSLTVYLLSQGVPPEIAIPYVVLSAILLLVVWVVLGLPTAAFHRALRERAAAFADLQRLNESLEQQVADRTAELAHSNTQLAASNAQIAAANTQLAAVMNRRQHEMRATAHDLNHGLLVTRTAIDMLLLDIEDAGLESEKINEARDGVDRGFHSIRDLVNNLFTAALLESDKLELKFQLLDLGSMTQGVVQQYTALAQARGCSLRLDLAETPVCVQADPQRLQRVVANLLGNAIKYTEKAVVDTGREGRIALRVGHVSDGVTITIKDNGIGMTLHDLERVGQPFARLSTAQGTDGTGLGLYTSKGIIAAHGGTMTFSSDGPDCGTRVTVWLPPSPGV